jgi:hypothetical protein
MTDGSNLEMALSWVTEADRTEFNCCVGQYQLYMNGICEFNLSDYRLIVKMLYFLYLEECDDNF